MVVSDEPMVINAVIWYKQRLIGFWWRNARGPSDRGPVVKINGGELINVEMNVKH